MISAWRWTVGSEMCRCWCASSLKQMQAKTFQFLRSPRRCSTRSFSIARNTIGALLRSEDRLSPACSLRTSASKTTNLYATIRSSRIRDWTIYFLQLTTYKSKHSTTFASAGSQLSSTSAVTRMASMTSRKSTTSQKISPSRTKKKFTRSIPGSDLLSQSADLSVVRSSSKEKTNSKKEGRR